MTASVIAIRPAVAALLTAVLAAGLPALGGCAGDPCSDDVVRRTTAPDHAHDAVVLVRDCGATSGWSTQVSVVDPGDVPRGAGNVFAADDDHGAAALDDRHALAVTLRWTGPGRLTVRYPRAARTFRTEPERDGVRVTYERG